MIWRGYLLLLLMLVGFSLFGEEYRSAAGGIRSPRVSVAPVFGRIFRLGPTASTVRNDFVAGLALNFPLSELFALEMQGLYGLNQVGALGITYGSSEYNGGMTLKLGFNIGPFRPYLGAGGQFVYYDNIYQYSASPDTWLGLAHGMAGLDIELSRNLVLGFRVTGSAPVVNRDRAYGFNAPTIVPAYKSDPINNFSWLLTARLWLVL